MKGGRVVGRAAGGGGGDSVFTSAHQNILNIFKVSKVTLRLRRMCWRHYSTMLFVWSGQEGT